MRWAYEVKAPASVDCTMGVPEVTKPIGEWLRAGFVPVRGEKLSAAEQAQPASLLQPEGIYGPAFLTTKNYFVIKEYNFSDLYVLFVGHLADRMTSPLPFATPWSASTQLRTTDVEAMQRGLTRIGLYKDKIDGKAGMQTRAALGAYPEIGRAQGGLLAERSGAALDPARRAERRKKKPGRSIGRVLKIAARDGSRVRSYQSQTRTRAEAPAVTVPVALALPVAAGGEGGRRSST